MVNRIFGSVALIGLLGCSYTANAGVSACREIIWQPYQSYSITAALHQRTHIILPEPIQGLPVPGSPVLWDVDGENIHLFIKPKNLGNEEGKVTTVTAITESNQSFDFVVTRVNSNPDVCVRIVQDNFRPQGVKHGWKSNLERENELLKSQLMLTKNSVQKVRTESKKKSLDILHEYRNNIYTRYEWKSKSKGFNQDSITDVYDDGRFTYIRFRDHNKGLLVVNAVINGKDEFIEADYDADKKLYTISGLFPKLVLKYDKSKIDIIRKDSQSKGSY